MLGSLSALCGNRCIYTVQLTRNAGLTENENFANFGLNARTRVSPHSFETNASFARRQWAAHNSVFNFFFEKI